jgi:hypothetical protein
MSLINDALKQARQAPPRNLQRPLPPLPPAARSVARNPWLVPAIALFLILAVVFYIGWFMAQRSGNNVVKKATMATATTVATPAVAEVAPPVIENPPPPPPPPPPPLLPENPENSPKLQGVFYSATAPAAIVNGKMVRPGDHYLNYRVTEITKYTVTLVGPDGKAIKLNMAN